MWIVVINVVTAAAVVACIGLGTGAWGWAIGLGVLPVPPVMLFMVLSRITRNDGPVGRDASNSCVSVAGGVVMLQVLMAGFVVGDWVLRLMGV